MKLRERQFHWQWFWWEIYLRASPLLTSLESVRSQIPLSITYILPHLALETTAVQKGPWYKEAWSTPRWLRWKHRSLSLMPGKFFLGFIMYFECHIPAYLPQAVASPTSKSWCHWQALADSQATGAKKGQARSTHRREALVQPLLSAYPPVPSDLCDGPSDLDF